MEDFSKLVGRIYDCSVNQSLWPGVLQTIAEKHRIDLVHLFAADPAQEAPLFSYSSVNLPLTGERSNPDRLVTELLRATLGTRPDSVRTDILPASDIESAPSPDTLTSHIWSEELFHYAISGVIQTGGIKVAAFLHSDEPRDRLKRRLTLVMELLRPHLARSFAISESLGAQKCDSHLAWDVLGRLQTGVTIINGDQTILHTNEEADRILAQNDGLARRGDQLIINQRHGHSAALDLLQNTCVPGKNETPGDRMSMFSIARPSGRRPLIIHARQLARTPVYLPPSTPIYSLLIKDMEHLQVNHITAFSHAYRLTPAEERLILALIGNATLKSHARGENISEETVRWHLKNIFSKTECRSQASLLNLVHASIIQEY